MDGEFSGSTNKRTNKKWSWGVLKDKTSGNIIIPILNNPRKALQNILAFPKHEMSSELDPGSGKSTRGGHGNPVFLPEESQRQRSLTGSSKGHKESDMTEVTW